ncbi:MAG: SPOR domain-containing protein [Muribaculaceae bacterium]|nr:SPOR domain-containing protein [Muribaculaceae bacterium]MBR5532054.1 SPOR domain-containing protein [Bacteroidales bacterium]
MKNITHLLIVAIVLIVSATALFAKDDSIVSELERQDNGGVVKVYQSPELTTLLLRDTTAVEERMVQGYRIQIYSDNMQRRAKEMAQERAKMIQEADSTLESYVTFNSPFWRVRVGNYSSYEEAAIKLRELKKQFPTIPDMRIVKDLIVEKY